MTQKTPVLKQFEWFEVQTKVRQIINQIISPFQKKLTSNSSAVTKLQEKDKVSSQKIEYLTTMVNNDPNIFETGIFAHIGEKFGQTDIRFGQIQNNFGNLQEYLRKQMDYFTQKIEQSNKTIEKVVIFKQFVQQQLEKQNDSIVKSTQNISSNFQAINSEILNLKLQIQAGNSKKQEDRLIQTKLSQTISENIEETNRKIEIFKQKLEKSQAIVEQTQEHTSYLLKQIKRIDNFESLNSKMKSKVSDFQTEVNKMSFKLEVVNPITVLTHVSQYLIKILPDKYYQKIMIYHKRKYGQLSQLVIQQSFPQDKLNIFSEQNIAIITRLHEQSIKLVFRLKRQKIIDNGVDFDHLSQQKKQELLQSINLELSDEFMKENEQQTKKQTSHKDQINQILRQKLHSIEFVLKEKIIAELQHSKQFIQEMEFILKKQQNILDKRMQKLQKNIKQTDSNIHLIEQNSSSQFTGLNDKVNIVSQTSTKQKQLLKEIQQILLIFCELERQDEKDRQSIALIGVKDYLVEDQQQPLKLNQNCLSCSGSNAILNSYFKTACLTYKSSPIWLGDDKISRIDLLNKLKKTIEGIGFPIEKPLVKNPQKKTVIREVSKQCDIQSSQQFKIYSRNSKSVAQKFRKNDISSVQKDQTTQIISTPRVIGNNQVSQTEFMNKTSSQLWTHKTKMALDRERTKKQSQRKNRRHKKDHMIHVTSFFSELKKRNQSIISSERF